MYNIHISFKISDSLLYISVTYSIAIQNPKPENGTLGWLILEKKGPLLRTLSTVPPYNEEG